MICELIGEVLKGKGMGRQLGFPTANLLISDVAHIQYGVYAASVFAGDVWRAAIVNVGKHPTFPEGPPSVEAHIIGYAADLYGKKLTIRFLRFLRDEKKFESVQALREQIQRDIDMLHQ